MFEKEAEETFRKNYTEYCCGKELLSPYWDLWQDGVEFGYNKANEWHKDLPTEDVNLAIIEVEDCGYLLCEYRKGVWYDNGSSAVCKDWITQNIKRWKEIVLPKESEKNV